MKKSTLPAVASLRGDSEVCLRVRGVRVCPKPRLAPSVSPMSAGAGGLRRQYAGASVAPIYYMCSCVV